MGFPSTPLSGYPAHRIQSFTLHQMVWWAHTGTVLSSGTTFTAP